MRFGRVFLLASLASAICIGQPDREKDVYAIYSLLLTNPQTSHGPDNNAKYLILDTTVAVVPAQPCLDAKGERRERITEILKDFETRKNARRKLQRDLKLSKPYELLTESEAKQFRNRNANPEWSIRFAGVTDLFSFSDVYFDKAGTLALTYISSWCGSLCALFQWKLLEKKADGSWKESPGVGCVAVASGLVKRMEANQPGDDALLAGFVAPASE